MNRSLQKRINFSRAYDVYAESMRSRVREATHAVAPCSRTPLCFDGFLPTIPAPSPHESCSTSILDDHQIRQMDSPHGARTQYDRTVRTRAGALCRGTADRELWHLELRLRYPL